MGPEHTQLPPAWHLQGKQRTVIGEDQGPGLGSSIPRALVLRGSPQLDFLLDSGSTTYGHRTKVYTWPLEVLNFYL